MAISGDPETILGGWCFSFGKPPWWRNAPYSYHPVRWFPQNFAIDWLKDYIYIYLIIYTVQLGGIFFPMPQTEKHHIMWKDARAILAQLPSFRWRWWLCWCSSMGWMKTQDVSPFHVSFWGDGHLPPLGSGGNKRWKCCHWTSRDCAIENSRQLLHSDLDASCFRMLIQVPLDT